MKNSKSLILVCVFSALFTFGAFSQNTNRILVDQSTLENSNGKDFWIASKIKTDFINDILNYSSIEVINSSDTDRIKALQKDSESASYGESVIELGKRIQAGKYVTLKTTRIGNTYTASFSVINITTGKTEAGYSMPKPYTEAEFISKAHGELAVQALKNFGVRLTPAVERLILGNGSLNINSGDSINEANENLEAIKTEQARLSKQLSTMDSKAMTSAQYDAQQARLKTQQALLVQEQKNAEQMLQRLKDDAARQQREAEARLQRDSQTQDEILAVTQDVERKAQEIREQNLKNMTAAQRINIIESEKQILVQSNTEISNNISSNTSRMTDAQNKEIAELDRRFSDKKSEEYKIYHNANGDLNTTGRQAYNDEKEYIVSKYTKLIAQNNADVKNKTNESQNTLRQKIESDIEDMEAQTYTADSISDNGLYFRVDDYDGDKQGWNFTYSFYFNGQEVLTNTGLLTYRDITGTYPASYAKKVDPEDSRYQAYQNYRNYITNVNKFDSYFRMNVPYIQATLKYTVRSGKYNEPSKYTLYIDAIDFTNLENSRKVSTKSISKAFTFQVTPITAVDYRTDSVRQTDAANETRRLAEERKMREAKEAEEAKQREIDRQKREIEKAKEEKKRKQELRDAAITKHTTLGTICFMPGIYTLYNSNDGMGVSAGYTLTIGLNKHLFVAADGELGINFNTLSSSSSTSSTISSYSFDGTSTTNCSSDPSTKSSSSSSDSVDIFITAQFGQNANLSQHVRLILLEEIGCVYNSFGLGVGAGLEIYNFKISGLDSGIGINYGLDWTYAHGFVDRYSVLCELCF